MILAGLVLLAVGVVDILRRYSRGRGLWITAGIAAVAMLTLGIVADAALFSLVAVVLAALWVWLMPGDARPRASFWPALGLAVVAAISVAFLPARIRVGTFGEGWHLGGPIGPVGMDLMILALGIFITMLETGNVIVRAALVGDREGTGASGFAGSSESLPMTGEPRGSKESEEVDGIRGVERSGDLGRLDARHPCDGAAPFRGGRLIGPLERVLVLMLTLVSAYALLAAMLAAKGIVRFPEISRDGENGERAEYFLVGSLVSWVVALGGSFLLWWAAT